MEGDVAGLDPLDHLSLRRVAVEVEGVRPAERAAATTTHNTHTCLQKDETILATCFRNMEMFTEDDPTASPPKREKTRNRRGD